MAAETIWYTRCPVPTAFSIAVRTGLLDAALEPLGTSARSLLASRDPAVRTAHFTQTQAASFRHGGHIPPLWSRAEGRDVRLIGLTFTPEVQRLVTLPDSAIRTPADLKGRRLSLPVRPNDPVDFWRATILRGYEAVLALAGLGLGDVELVEVPVTRTFIGETPQETDARGSLWSAALMRGLQREEAFALIRGTVDAIFVPGSLGADLVPFLGARTVAELLADGPPLATLNNSTLLAFTVDGAFLQRRPDVVEAVLAASLKAAAWATSHPEAATRIVAAETGLAEDLVPAAYGPDIFGRLAPSLSSASLDLLDRQTAWLARNGFLPRQPHRDEWVEPGPLGAAQATPSLPSALSLPAEKVPS